MILFFFSTYIYILLLSALLLLFITFNVHKLRYNSAREFMVSLICALQGRRSVWVRDPKLAAHILSSFDSKGSCIEELLSVPAWAPILSLESVDGPQWTRMKKSLRTLMPYLPPTSELTTITSRIVDEYLSAGAGDPGSSEGAGAIIDSHALVHIVIASMFEWLFETPFKTTEWDFVAAASWEWRKEISTKGKANPALKRQVVTWIQTVIKASKYYHIFGEDWAEPEYYSLFLQPFLISPAINISDIAVTLASEPYQTRLSQVGASGLLQPQDQQNNNNNNNNNGGGVSRDHIIYAITFSHPFPVFERWLPDGLLNNASGAAEDGAPKYLIPPNTQVLIPIDQLGLQHHAFGSKSGTWMGFGAGKRACAGKDISLAMCLPLFSKLIGHPSFQPAMNHQYSGRNNDGKESWSQMGFQIQLLFRILGRICKKQLLST